MIDINTETILSIADAARRLPGKPHLSTVWRWITSGTRYGKLESVVIGGQRFTSAEALQRFAEQSTRAATGRPLSPSTKEREAAITKAEADLAKLGI
jgi:hypothetical protein